MTNTRFRYDYWVRAPRRLSTPDRLATLRRQRLVLVSPRADVRDRVDVTLGTIVLPAAWLARILDLFGDHRVHSVGEIETALHGKGMEFAQLLEIVRFLLETGALAVAQHDDAVRSARPRCERLNAFLAARAETSQGPFMLASPLTSTPLVFHTRLPMMLWQAMRDGAHSPAELANRATQALTCAGVSLTATEQAWLEDGKPVETAITAQVALFLRVQLPLMRALQIA